MTLRSPLTALGGERLAGIGHNQGPPLDGARSWRTHCWRKARRELVPRLPLEIVRRRVRRATQLGLDYPQYASILLGTGRDVVAFLFTSDGLGLRLERALDLAGPVAEKLAGLEGADRLLACETQRGAEAFAAHLLGRHAIRFSGHAAVPDRPGLSWAEGREVIRAALAPLGLPGDGVVMIGTRTHERTWADAARLAKFLPAGRYFPTA